MSAWRATGPTGCFRTRRDRVGLGLGLRARLRDSFTISDSGRNVTPEDLRVGDDLAMFGSWFVLLPFLASPVWR